MSFASRPSLAGLSRRFQSSADEALAENRTSRRLGALGMGVSLLFSLVAVLPVTGGESQRASALSLSLILSSALASTLVIGVGSFIWGAGLLLGRRTRAAQWAAGLAVAALVFVYVLFRGAGEAFRLSSGETLGLGSCEFLVEGFAQLALPLLLEYWSWVGLLIGTGALLSALSLWMVVGPRVGPLIALRLMIRGTISLAVFGGLTFALSSPRGSHRAPLTATSDLSLLASWAQRKLDHQALAAGDGSGGALVRKGPLRSVEAGYEAVVRLRGSETRPSPNVLLIMLESVGIDHLSHRGYERSTTPHIDELALESWQLTQARTTATHSNYAQMAILSSLFPRRYAGLDTYKRLDYPRLLWHDLLASVGYGTATFSSQDERWQGMIRFESTSEEHPIFHSANFDGPKLMMGSERTIPDDVTARRAVRWIKSQKKPFGLYVNFQSTHFPYVVPRKYKKKYLPDRPTRGKFHYLNYPKTDRPAVINRYDNALSFVDEQVGFLLRSLRELELHENTIVVLTSDHGEMFGQHKMVTHGRTLFDGEARVPLMIRYPGHVPPTRDARDVSTLDVLPTLAGLLDLPLHPSFQGHDLQERDEGHRPVFINIQGMRSREGVICDGYKYTRSPSGAKPALFHLQDDLGERKNLVDVEPDRAALLDRFLAAHMRAQMAYYRPADDSIRQRRFAPRLSACPQLNATPPEDELTFPSLQAGASSDSVQHFN